MIIPNHKERIVSLKTENGLILQAEYPQYWLDTLAEEDGDEKVDTLADNAKVKRVNQYVWKAEGVRLELKFLDPNRPTPPETRFPHTETRDVSYDDGLLHRSRHSKLLIYSPTQVWHFEGESIDGVVAVREQSYSKNGKWSSTTYQLTVAAGLKAVRIEQGWESGRYVDNITSPKAMLKCLGLDGMQMKWGIEYLKTRWYGYWCAFKELEERLEALEGNSPEGVMNYDYSRQCHAKRQGDVKLLITYPDGRQEVWDEKENEYIKILSHSRHSGTRGGSDDYRLSVDSRLHLTEHTEYDPYGDGDALESLGWYYKQDDSGYGGKWVNVNQQDVQEEGDEPIDESTTMVDAIAALKNKFGKA